MTRTKLMGIPTAILSIALMALFVPSSAELLQDVFAEQNTMEQKNMQMTTQIQTQENISLEFNVPQTITAGKLVPINARVLDSDLGANLSHTDWAYSVSGPNGEIVHKSTTLHGHFGVMNFKDSFPGSGTYTIKYTVSSSGSFMLGMPIPELGQTRAVVSGDILKFEQDPKNNFGTRTFEFTVDVVNQEKTVVLKGSQPDTEVLVKFTTKPERIVVGQPTTILIDVDDAKTGEDATHVDGQLTVRRGYYHYPSASGEQPSAPIPLHGAYHGHKGAMATTHTFSQPGTYIISADLSSIPYSVPNFGESSAIFVIQVHENEMLQSMQNMKPVESTKENTVGIVGLESPFYVPNMIKVTAGQTITFDNVDGNQHTVTSVKQGTTEFDGRFDSGLLQHGEKFELALNEKGTYDYFCALHTSMRGTIIVS
ncbi:cupredoxin domain-containing protein [Nitrosopumilus sp. K4]|uniref:cupredoxin domain-containing protein n=1 Tax=Nitrosopumilus sp. K4 TaxID=2795383 RepID=UPI001BA567D4|nr:plastocyanin/azurin family copper-binding protein [Nitrosopumilus sp. K4]QUC64147.1 cupredoxin domain-containing protein [Nitrosopumilus sp. K4]